MKPSKVTVEVEVTVKTRRGTTNRNARGSADARRRRREWLVKTYRANLDFNPRVSYPQFDGAPFGTGLPACRCYRCGILLTVEFVTADRIKPGCEGGTYKRENIRPCCSLCNSETGARLGNARTAAKKAKMTARRSR